MPLVLATVSVIGLLLRIRHLKGKRLATQLDQDNQRQKLVISHSPQPSTAAMQQPSTAGIQQPSIAELRQPSIAGMQELLGSARYELDRSSGDGQAPPELYELGSYTRTSRGESDAQVRYKETKRGVSARV